MLINYAILSGGLVLIELLYRFVIDNTTCYYFSSYGVLNRKKARVKIANRNPWYDKMIGHMMSKVLGNITYDLNLGVEVTKVKVK